MTELSVLVPFVPRRPEQVLPLAGLVAWTRAARLWQGQSMLVEPHHGFVAAAGAGIRVPVGTGVTLMPLRSPYEAALQARSVALATGHPVLAGFGPGSRALQESVRGAAYESPLTLAREYVGAVRGLLDGGVVELAGDYVRMRAQLAPAAAPDVRVGLGVLRPAMARVAGEVADAAITWLTPPDYLREVVVPAVEAGAAAAGRPRPRVVAMVPVALTRDGVDHEDVALASNAAHLAAPHYRDMLRRAGVDVDVDDAATRARRLLECRGFLAGDLDSVLKGITEYADAGADEVVLNTTGVHRVCGGPAALQDLQQILDAA